MKEPAAVALVFSLCGTFFCAGPADGGLKLHSAVCLRKGLQSSSEPSDLIGKKRSTEIVV